MVIDLDVLVDEMARLQKHGLDPRITLDPRAHVIMPWHKDLDGLNERASGVYGAGSTNRGIGPCYASKHERTGVRVADFFGDSARVKHLANIYAWRVAFEKGKENFNQYAAAGTKQVYLRSIAQTLERTAFLQNCLGDVSVAVACDLDAQRNILGECAQAEMLDVDSPYYPRGTSSGTSAAGFLNGLGILPLKHIGEVVGVAKAYVTRVGNGSFVTEIQGELADTLREKGGEYGTTTGRSRRIGWLDLPMLKHAKTAGLTSLALTKIDVISGMDEIPVAVHYKEGDEIPCLGYEKRTPVYENMQGWRKFSTDEYRKQLENGVDYISDTSLRCYLQKIEDEVGLPISMISYGQDSNAFTSYL